MYETDACWSGHPPMSVRHVMELVALAPKVPSHLLKTLLCLAVLADHKTGLVRPAGRQQTTWGIPTSTWGDHVTELKALGWIEQTVKGSKKARRAAEYRLTMPGLPEETTNPADRLPSRREGSSSSSTATATPAPEGRNPANRIPPPLTAAEDARLKDLMAELPAYGLTPEDRDRLNAGLKQMDQAVPLLRSMVRLELLGARHELVCSITERRNAGPSVYSGAKNPAAALWGRVEEVADRYGVDMLDPTEAVTAPDLDDEVLGDVDVEGQKYLNSLVARIGRGGHSTDDD